MCVYLRAASNEGTRQYGRGKNTRWSKLLIVCGGHHRVPRSSAFLAPLLQYCSERHNWVSDALRPQHIFSRSGTASARRQPQVLKWSPVGCTLIHDDPPSCAYDSKSSFPADAFVKRVPESATCPTHRETSTTRTACPSERLSSQQQ